MVQKSSISGYSKFLEFDFHPDFQIIFKSVLMIKELFITLFLIGWSESKDWDLKLIFLFGLGCRLHHVVSSPGTRQATLSTRRPAMADFPVKLSVFMNRTVYFHFWVSCTGLKHYHRTGRP